MSKITAGKKRFVKRQLGNERATVLIGKLGLSEHLIKEITKQLDKNKMIKVKILKTALAEHEAKQFAQKIADQTKSALVEVRGHTFMLFKRRENKTPSETEASKP